MGTEKHLLTVTASPLVKKQFDIMAESGNLFFSRFKAVEIWQAVAVVD